MTKREALLKKMSTYQFAALDMQLYLDTHPNDSATMEQMQQYRQKAMELREQFEEQFGALTKSETEGNKWKWIKGPWPWESEEDC